MKRRGGAGNSYIVSVDIGTSSVKTMLSSIAGTIVAQERASYASYYPQPDYVEQNADEVLDVVVGAIGRMMESAAALDPSVEALVFGGIWQSFLSVDIEGRPLHRAITWADRRSEKQNDFLRAHLDNENVRKRTGCSLHPMYFLSRILWAKENSPDIYKRTARFISIKEYVLFRLFGVSVVDHSTASGTGVWNMAKRNWDFELLAEAGIGEARFSECVEPTSIVGGLKPDYAAAMGLAQGTPAIVGAADGALAHLGAVGLSGQRMSLSVGTSMALRQKLAEPQIIGGSEVWCYYLADGIWMQGGVAHDGGNTLRWFADNILGAPHGEEKVFDRMNELARHALPGASGLFVFPLFGGERCPNYRPGARGGILGLSFDHGAPQLTRALYEGFAFYVRALYHTLARESQPDIVVTGGILKSPVWIEIIADCLGVPLLRPEVEESAAWGGVALGLRAIGVYPDLAAASAALARTAKSVVPDPARAAAYKSIMSEYDRLYARLYGD